MEENTSNATGFLNATTDITENHQIDTAARITILHPLVEENTSNATGFLNTASDITENHQIDTITQITILYPIVGLSIVVMSMGYLVLAIKNYRQIPAVGSQVKSDKNDSDVDHQTLNRNQWFLLVIMMNLLIAIMNDTFVKNEQVKHLVQMKVKFDTSGTVIQGI